MSGPCKPRNGFGFPLERDLRSPITAGLVVPTAVLAPRPGM